MCISRSARKGQFCLGNLCGFMFRWINVAVLGPCGQFIHWADPYGGRPVINISPRTLQAGILVFDTSAPVPVPVKSEGSRTGATAYVHLASRQNSTATKKSATDCDWSVTTLCRHKRAYDRIQLVVDSCWQSCMFNFYDQLSINGN